MLRLAPTLIAGITLLIPSQAEGVDERLMSMPPGPKPMVVHCGFDLWDINGINEEEETLEFVGTLTLEWVDPRQAFDPGEAGTAEKLYHGDFQFNEVSPGWYPQVYLANQSGGLEIGAILQRIHADGRCRLDMAITAVAEVDLNMRLYPFDHQKLDLHFALFGFSSDEVTLEATSASIGDRPISQWTMNGMRSSVRTTDASTGPVSEMVVTLDLSRDAIFILRLVWLPLGLIVALSWTVFWMDRSSLGDRLNVSFVGVLTAVAYQLVIGDLLPHVSYFTLMHAFLNVSFFIMCAGAVLNLIAASHERTGRTDHGDLIDMRCRWIFPVAYLVLVVVSIVLMHLLPPVL